MRACVRAGVSISVSVMVSVSVCVCVCPSTSDRSLCLCVCARVRMRACVSVYVYVCAFVSVCVWMLMWMQGRVCPCDFVASHFSVFLYFCARVCEREIELEHSEEGGCPSVCVCVRGCLAPSRVFPDHARTCLASLGPYDSWVLAVGEDACTGHDRHGPLWRILVTLCLHPQISPLLHLSTVTIGVLWALPEFR